MWRKATQRSDGVFLALNFIRKVDCGCGEQVGQLVVRMKTHASVSTNFCPKCLLPGKFLA